MLISYETEDRMIEEFRLDKKQQNFNHSLCNG